MTAHSSDKPALPYAETGWAKAHRRQGRGVRTCLPAVLDRPSGGQRDASADDHIVRGED
ncbi:hypothetical protein GCM10010521_73250 [Streptomyces rameus]|uniref:Uncharacterized protein n=1 Tax=Streptomyces rameus TaxID=68261 RepID=A0ABP6HQ98_9ACTN